MRRAAAALALAASLALPQRAQAFCGFYVSGATAELYNNATVVVLMREGTRTVLSMANNYQGPPENFALVVPVPVVLQKDNVKTLPREIFTHVDQLAAPRLVEYWERDPCYVHNGRSLDGASGSQGTGQGFGSGNGKLGGSHQVKIEAQFTVGEYEVVILSAEDSGGLDAWLREQKYNIPAGAEPILKPYVQGGMKFFVAKVDISKVQKQGDKTMLSPLRFHYDTDKFELPVRLGLLNSSGKQDLLVHILARGKRYELANYPNVTIPTNLDVGEITKEQFGPFYAALFDKVLENNPTAVVTEYAWDAGSCDPCPTPALRLDEIATLGGDVAFGAPPKPGSTVSGATPQGGRLGSGGGRGWTLTRLHARYGKEMLGEDLVFREAGAILGGRERRQLGSGTSIEEGATPTHEPNAFQARYAIRHPWRGKAECANPRWGVWGGPPDGDRPALKPATDLAFVPRGQLDLAGYLRTDVPGLNLQASADEPSPLGVPSGSASVSQRPPPAPSASSPGATSPGSAPSGEPPKSGCGSGCASSGRGGQGWLAAAGALALLGRGRASRRSGQGRR